MELIVENVQSYPRPPALEPVTQRVRVMFGGEVIADTTAALRVLETHHAPSYYLPHSDVTADLSPVAGTSFCEWKGRATYWTLTAGGMVAEAAAWSYPNPSARFAALKNHLAIYAGRMDACFVGAVQVLPQPGDFYGGWVTPNLTGQIKGAPGTRHW
ncbi:MAG: DUF427 domain-containing protein [Lentilitoribacter sp.]|uniref:DUF427 domain-containing protein n=1 Tax=Tateyamaria sp. TaxID=1929288 RepID=UPI00327950A3